jgi:60S ribosome subunit biogenesis protein NIP7
MENWRRKLGHAPVHTIEMFQHSETVMKIATNFGREKLLSLGTCVGKFTKTDRFMLSITFLDYLSQYAKVRDLGHFSAPLSTTQRAKPPACPCLQYKVWVKPSSEMSFLYGNNVVKSGLGRMTEGIPKYAGVVVYSMTDIPLGTPRRTRHVDPTLGPIITKGHLREVPTVR